MSSPCCPPTTPPRQPQRKSKRPPMRYHQWDAKSYEKLLSGFMNLGTFRSLDMKQMEALAAHMGEEYTADSIMWHMWHLKRISDFSEPGDKRRLIDFAAAVAAAQAAEAAAAVADSDDDNDGVYHGEEFEAAITNFPASVPDATFDSKDPYNDVLGLLDCGIGVDRQFERELAERQSDKGDDDFPWWKIMKPDVDDTLLGNPQLPERRMVTVTKPIDAVNRDESEWWRVLTTDIYGKLPKPMKRKPVTAIDVEKANKRKKIQLQSQSVDAVEGLPEVPQLPDLMIQNIENYCNQGPFSFGNAAMIPNYANRPQPSPSQLPQSTFPHIPNYFNQGPFGFSNSTDGPSGDNGPETVEDPQFPQSMLNYYDQGPTRFGDLWR